MLDVCASYWIPYFLPLSNWREDRSLEEFGIDIRLNDARQWIDAEEEHEDREKHNASVAVESQNKYRTRSINK